MQVSASITYLPSPSEMAETGHSLSQEPQEMHLSSIAYAMNKSSFSISNDFMDRYLHTVAYYSIIIAFCKQKTL